MSQRQKSYAPRHKLEPQFGLAGAWDGRKRPLEPSVKPRESKPFGGLAPEEFAALTPEEKIALANERKQ